MSAKNFRKFGFVRVYDSDSLVKSTATIVKIRCMPSGRQITVYTSSGWPSDMDRSFICSDMNQARLIIEDHFCGMPYKRA